MSDATFRSSESPEMDFSGRSQSDMILDEFFMLEGWLGGDDPLVVAQEYPQTYPPHLNAEFGAPSLTNTFLDVPSSTESGREKKDVKERFAFKTKSDVEILDDGYKWRKYGKKMVKNSPNPRNYYKCSAEGCSVKKRVERDREDPKYVITTYEGIHNHQGP